MKTKSYVIVNDTAENTSHKAIVLARMQCKDLTHAEMKREILYPNLRGRLISFEDWRNEIVPIFGRTTYTRAQWNEIKRLNSQTPISSL